MTYPPQYMYPPTQGQPQPPTVPQPTYGQPPLGYHAGPPPVQPAPAPQAMYTPPQFSEPSGGGEGGSPLKIREIEGRICGVQPVKYIEETLNPNGSVKDSAKIVLDILVLDGPTPLEYGASNGYQDNPPGPPVYALDSLPALIKGVTVGNWQVVKKAKEVLDTAPGNTIPCRIVRGTQGQNPYFLAQIGGDLDPGTTPEEGARLRGMLGAAYAAVQTGRWPDGSPYVAPVPREINGGPRQKPTQAAPAQPTAVQYPPAPPAGQVVYPPAGPTHPIGAAFAPMAQAYAQAAQAQQYGPTREQYLSGEAVPDGWNADVWRTNLDRDKRAQFLPAQ